MLEQKIVLTGIVKKTIPVDDNYIIYIDTTRGLRKVGDHLKTLRIEQVSMITKAVFPLNSLLYAEGVLKSQVIEKTVVCDKCGAENVVGGRVVFVIPSYTSILKENAENGDLKEYREISNSVYTFGRLVRDPGRTKNKREIEITQFQIAPPNETFSGTYLEPQEEDIWVKAYGAQAEEYRWRLRYGSIIFVDGFLQERSTLKHCVCEKCQESFDWNNQSMEIVPYDIEYLGSINSDEIIENKKLTYFQQIKRDTLKNFGLDIDEAEEEFLW